MLTSASRLVSASSIRLPPRKKPTTKRQTGNNFDLAVRTYGRQAQSSIIDLQLLEGWGGEKGKEFTALCGPDPPGV